MDTPGAMMAGSSGFGRYGFHHRLAEKGVPMQSSGRMRAQITTLIITTSLTQFANGFFGLDARIVVLPEPGKPHTIIRLSVLTWV